MAEAPKSLKEAYTQMMAQRNEAPPGDGAVLATPPEPPAEPTPEVQATEGQQNVPPAPSAPPVEQPAVDPMNLVSQQTEALRNATGMVQQMQTQNQQLRQEVERLRSAMDEQNSAAEIAEMRQAVTPPAPPQMPSFDDIAYISDEEKQRRQAEYTTSLASFLKGQIMDEVQPYIDRAKEADLRDAEEAIILKFSDPQSGYADFAEYVPMIRNIAKNNPLVANAEMNDDKILTAYAIAKGIKSNIPQPAKLKLSDEDKKLLSNEELLEIYRSNPDLQKMIASEQIQKVQETGEVPVFSASGDVGNVALTPDEKPKTLADARKIMSGLFRH